MKTVLTSDSKQSFYVKPSDGLIQEGFKQGKDQARSDRMKMAKMRLAVFPDSKPGMYIGSQELRWLASGGEEGEDARNLYSNEHKEIINQSKPVLMCNLHKVHLDTSCTANRSRITALFWATNFRNTEDEDNEPNMTLQPLHLEEGQTRTFDGGYVNIKEDKPFAYSFLTKPRLDEVFAALCCCAYEALYLMDFHDGYIPRSEEIIHTTKKF